ncbi:MAG: hypothetical protein HC798_02695 [Polaribacter sp.]|nr:hypothetical protein [Polaribacter sp.]
MALNLSGTNYDLVIGTPWVFTYKPQDGSGYTEDIRIDTVHEYDDTETREAQFGYQGMLLGADKYSRRYVIYINATEAELEVDMTGNNVSIYNRSRASYKNITNTSIVLP